MLCGADHQGAPDGLNHVVGDGGEAVDLQDAADLDEEAVQEAEFAACVEDDGGHGLGVGCVQRGIVQRTASTAPANLFMARKTWFQIAGTMSVSDMGSFADEMTGTFIGYTVARPTSGPRSATGGNLSFEIPADRAGDHPRSAPPQPSTNGGMRRWFLSRAPRKQASHRLGIKYLTSERLPDMRASIWGRCGPNFRPDHHESLQV